MAFSGDVDADGVVELLIPNQNFTSLNAIHRNGTNAELEWEIPLDAKLITNIASARINNQSFAVAVGLENGILRIWQP